MKRKKPEELVQRGGRPPSPALPMLPFQAVFIPPPRLLTRVADTRPGRPWPLALCPGEATQRAGRPARGLGGGVSPGRARLRHLCQGTAAFGRGWAPPPRCEGVWDGSM